MAPRRKQTKTPPSSNDMLSRFLTPYANAMKSGESYLKDDASDYAVVLAAASTIEYLLKIAIVTRFRRISSLNELSEIFDGYGALATLDSKIRLTSALGLLTPDMRHDLALIKTIRNLFAHSPQIKKFSDEDIRSRCLSLTLKAALKREIASVPKKHFVESVTMLHAMLIATTVTSRKELEYGIAHKAEIWEEARARIHEIFKVADLPANPEPLE